MFVLFTVGKGCFELPSKVPFCYTLTRFHLFSCLSLIVVAMVMKGHDHGWFLIAACLSVRHCVKDWMSSHWFTHIGELLRSCTIVWD